MAKRINRLQLTRKYWPAWRAAEKVLIATGGYSKSEAEALRKEITGSSSKDLTNNGLDLCLAKFKAISDPKNGKAQADLADQPLRRMRFAIGQIQKRLDLPDSYVEGISQQMHRRSVALCDERQLRSILQALSVHEKRHEKSVEA